MKSSEEFFKTPAALEFFTQFKLELLNVMRPPNEIILDEATFIHFLNISKRHSADLRASRVITYSKHGGKLYYRLSDVLAFIDKNEIKSIDRPGNIFKFKKPRK